ncbi:hypothetical protein L7F22_060393 [Adiantum nelumboides]|nr:hypothetical protein [Adiantum nelumboides]
MWVSTFHSMCVRILRREAKHLGVRSAFSVYDADDSRRLIGIVGRDLELDPKKFAPRALAAQISNLKNELLSPDDASERAGTEHERRIAEVYGVYQARLRQANAFDFDDLIMETVSLLQRLPAVAEYYRRRFRHVLVDEYQDTNHAQYELVRQLVAPATERATRRADFPDARTILLEQNYRSTQTILTAANAVIARNPERRDKRLWSDQGDGERIVGYVADNEHDEAAFVAAEIDRLVDSGEFRNSDIAVFYRTNAQSRVFEEVFIRTGLPYKVVGGVRFYERREVRDALAYLRVLANPEDTVSLRRILNVPKRGIGDRAEAIVAEYAERERTSFARALRAAAEEPQRLPALATRSQKNIAGFVRMLDELRELVERGDDTAEVLEAVYARTGYLEELQASEDPQDGTRMDNLAELVTVAREFAGDAAVADLAPDDGAAIGSGARSADGASDGAAPEGEADTYDDTPDGVPEPGSLAAFLERVALVADADSIPDDDSGVVTMMTLHTAKGLEFPVVFLTGWEDGIFPHLRTLGDPKELAEERRLAYVGITRAEKRLYLSRAIVRSAFGQPSTNPASRFLDEVPPSLLDWRRTEEQLAAQRPSAPVGRFGFGKRPQATDRGSWKVPERSLNNQSLHLDVGDRVNHDKYGLGTVVAADGIGPRATVTIDFGSGGTHLHRPERPDDVHVHRAVARRGARRGAVGRAEHGEPGDVRAGALGHHDLDRAEQQHPAHPRGIGLDPDGAGPEHRHAVGQRQHLRPAPDGGDDQRGRGEDPAGAPPGGRGELAGPCPSREGRGRRLLDGGGGRPGGVGREVAGQRLQVGAGAGRPRLRRAFLVLGQGQPSLAVCALQPGVDRPSLAVPHPVRRLVRHPAILDRPGGPGSGDRRSGVAGARRGGDVEAARGQPRQWVDLGAVRLPHLEVQVRAGGLAAVADLGDLVAGLDLLALLHERPVDVAVDGAGAVGVLEHHPHPEAAGGPDFSTTPSVRAKIGVPIGAARSMPLCCTPQRAPKPEVNRPAVGMTRASPLYMTAFGAPCDIAVVTARSSLAASRPIRAAFVRLATSTFEVESRSGSDAACAESCSPPIAEVSIGAVVSAGRVSLDTGSIAEAASRA